MLPRSCLRCAASKSNSSTRLPRSTTTRVSSGWVASMSILLAIKQSHEGRPAVRSAPYRRWGTGASPISGEGNGLDTPNAAGIARTAGKRAARMQPNLDFPLEDLREDLRLEHELQTAMRATAEPSQFLSIAHGIGATSAPAARRPLGYPPRTGFRLSFSSRESALLAGPPSSARFGAEGGRKLDPPWVPSFSWGATLGAGFRLAFAGCPNATQPEPVTVSTFFLKPRTVNWQATSEFRLISTTFHGFQWAVFKD